MQSVMPVSCPLPVCGLGVILKVAPPCNGCGASPLPSRFSQASAHAGGSSAIPAVSFKSAVRLVEERLLKMTEAAPTQGSAPASSVALSWTSTNPRPGMWVLFVHWVLFSVVTRSQAIAPQGPAWISSSLSSEFFVGSGLPVPASPS